ncbi:HSF-type DNA-binding-domain-containing protein [Auriculariales sp. MPI-PUGE-AT-0066]|nr:HSF-type DNA-binding-domain-containing protein [Auriculariales sp. MPI-PUGE-AT-0066]
MADIVYPGFDDQRASNQAAAFYPTQQQQPQPQPPTLPSHDEQQQQGQAQPASLGSPNGTNDGDADDGGRNGDKSDVKPQATFLTKLYALLEKPENQHMIRWDAQGDHIIVERPEQLALHVLPSVYRQSRFASFSRQLNIYGFMRKVNLRNVDPSIDDPDASTWSHPTLNRHSPPDVVANFKRRVPPRLPKAKKRADAAAAAAAANVADLGALNVPRSAGGPLAPAPLVPSSVPPFKTRNRAFTAPGSYVPPHHHHHGTQPGQPWSHHGSYSRNGGPMPLPPLNLPDAHANNMYNHMQPHSAAEETPTAFAYGAPPPPAPNMPPRDPNSMYNLSSSYPYHQQQQHSADHQNWGYHSHVTNSPGSSISSLLNPTVSSHSSYHQSRPAPISTHLSPVQPSYPSPFSSVPLQGTPSGSSMSPDSRPTTGYSNYDDSMGVSRPNTGNRPVTPGSVGRPGSSHDTLSIRRGRRHSQAVNPYPSPYEMDHRPGTAPTLTDVHPSMQRTKSLIQLPSVESYCFTPGPAEFAYTPNGPAIGGGSSTDSSMDGSWMSSGRDQGDLRPSTAHSQMSTQSHSSANTPPTEQPYPDAEMQRCE